jgi:hypothetical protein
VERQATCLSSAPSVRGSLIKAVCVALADPNGEMRRYAIHGDGLVLKSIQIEELD